MLLPATPPTEDGELKPFPASHRRAQTDRPLCLPGLPAPPPPITWGEEMETLGGACPFLDRFERLEAGPWGQDGLARKGCPRRECDEEAWLLCTWVLTSGGPAPSLLLPLPQALLPGLLSWEPPCIPCLPRKPPVGVDISLPPSHYTEKATLQAPPTRAPPLWII